MRKSWTDKENNFLRKAYNNEPISKIAKALMRSEQSIRNHVHILRKKGFAFNRVRDIANAEQNFFKGEKWEKKYLPPTDRFDEHMDYSGAFESDIEEYEIPSVSEQMQDELEPITHPTQHDESDDIEAAKRVMISKALYNEVDNA